MRTARRIGADPVCPHCEWAPSRTALMIASAQTLQWLLDTYSAALDAHRQAKNAHDRVRLRIVLGDIEHAIAEKCVEGEVDVGAR